MLDPERFITPRARAIDASGIRRVFDLAATLEDPINLSIGQPDFDVPESVKEAAIRAIQDGFNRYTVTQGAAPLRDKVARSIAAQFPGWGEVPSADKAPFGTLITSGVSGALVLAMLVCVGPGDEVIIPDPYFVMYKHLVTLAGAKPVYVDTYPDFQLTAERIEPYITPRTRMVLFNSPSNPTGVVASDAVCRSVAEICRERNILLLSDEIYDEFWYDREGVASRCPSPASYSSDMLLLRGFSKTYGMTGWRLGYATGPRRIIEEMTKLQQYSFVCAPSMVQLAGVAALNEDVSAHVGDYRRKRDLVIERLAGTFELTPPGGAFYAFPKVPPALGLTATQFVERAVAASVLVIPGSVFSRSDTHFRLSYACDDRTLERGLDTLIGLARI